MNGPENGLHCVACRVFGFAVVAALLIALIAFRAWGALAFIAVGVTIGWGAGKLRTIWGMGHG